MNRETFAFWSFERDLSVGCFECKVVKKWEDLEEDEKQSYLEEADHYLSIPEAKRAEEWPEDVLERMKTEA